MSQPPSRTVGFLNFIGEGYWYVYDTFEEFMYEVSHKSKSLWYMKDFFMDWPLVSVDELTLFQLETGVDFEVVWNKEDYPLPYKIKEDL